MFKDIVLLLKKTVQHKPQHTLRSANKLLLKSPIDNPKSYGYRAFCAIVVVEVVEFFTAGR